MLYRTFIVIVALISVSLPGGCSVLPPALVGARSSVELVSVDGSTALRPALPTRLYRFVDENTADVILTDLSLEELTSADAPPATGQIVHLQLFMRPMPGRTPIAREACSTSIRCAVLARGQVGMYGGGGFLIPESKPGGQLFGGSMSRGSLRLIKSTGQFVDRLGPTHADVSFTANRDDDAVTTWLSLMDRLALVGVSVEQPAPTAPEEPVEKDNAEPASPE